jgi:hypothetical protein
MAQIPDGAAGVAAGVMVYSFICLLGSSMVIWLTWMHMERFSCKPRFVLKEGGSVLTLSRCCVLGILHDIEHPLLTDSTNPHDSSVERFNGAALSRHQQSPR